MIIRGFVALQILLLISACTIISNEDWLANKQGMALTEAIESIKLSNARRAQRNMPLIFNKLFTDNNGNKVFIDGGMSIDNSCLVYWNVINDRLSGYVLKGKC